MAQATQTAQPPRTLEDEITFHLFVALHLIEQQKDNPHLTPYDLDSMDQILEHVRSSQAAAYILKAKTPEGHQR